MQPPLILLLTLFAMDRRKVATSISRYVQSELSKLSDPKKASRMAAYMKVTDASTFYGAQKPDRSHTVKAMKSNFAIESQAAYEQSVGELWNLPHREEKYLALDLARMHKEYITPSALDLYESMIRTGAWWDFVDDIASNLAGGVLLENRKETKKIMDRWIKDEDMWIRRAAILSQLRHKKETDHRMLFKYCRSCMHESEFFIRKAIGWALREYSKTDPERVLEFVEKERSNLSGLSYREGTKVLKKEGLL